LETTFDTSGRQTHRRVTTLDGDFDGAVLRISTTHDSLGRRQLVTQYDNATVGSGSVVDEVKLTYSDWGDVETYEQDNDSAVGGSGVAEYQVSYAFAKATNGWNTIRRKSMALPSGAGYTLSYSSSGNRLDADASRITYLQDGVLPSPSTSIVEYEYVGVGQVVGREYLTVDVKQEYFGGSGYDSLDRFNRVTNDIWVKDLATDRAIYDVDITYDRNSNITLLDDNVHAVAFDAEFTMDDLDRLTKATEGDLDGNSTIQTTEREEEWTLTQSDNWQRNKLDLDGNGTYTGTDELDEERTHNTVNELVARDIDDDDTDDYTLSHDEAGNLTDDGEHYTYEYDAFYRLRTVRDRSDESLVAEYRYNGLGHRIAEHVDTDNDGDVNGTDPWHHFAYNERWQMVAMFVDSDTDPTEEYLHHYAGDDGYGSASYIDDVVFRDRDTDGNGSLDERIWYAQNWRHDVVAIVDDAGHQLEMVRYSAYGVHFGMPGGDADSDGDNDSADHSQILTWGTSGPYDVRGDMDLDGDIDNSDKTTAEGAPFNGATLGRGNLSLPEVASGRAYAGYVLAGLATSVFSVRSRELQSHLGTWAQRDSREYTDSTNQYVYVRANPMLGTDPTGSITVTSAPAPPVGQSSYGSSFSPRPCPGQRSDIIDVPGFPDPQIRDCQARRFLAEPSGSIQAQVEVYSQSNLPRGAPGYSREFRSFLSYNIVPSGPGVRSGSPCRFSVGFIWDIDETEQPGPGGQGKDTPFYRYWHNEVVRSPEWLMFPPSSDCFVWVGEQRGFSQVQGTFFCNVEPGEFSEFYLVAYPIQWPQGWEGQISHRIRLICDSD